MDQRASVSTAADVIETDIPARLDRLPWGRFHTLVVAALGITWILDGLEVTLAGSVAGALKASPVLQFSNAEVGLAASAYLAGAVLGALFFGWLTDRLGRKKLFFITLAVYLVATAATALLMESLELRAVPLSHRRRHRRRIRRDQLDHPGAGAGARARLDRSRHQRQLLDRRGARRARRDRAARSGADRSRTRLAAGLPHRRRAGAGDLLHAAVAAGKPALADDPWPRRRGRAHRRRHRAHACSARRAAAADLPRVRLRTRSHTPLAEVVHTLLHRASPADAGRA